MRQTQEDPMREADSGSALILVLLVVLFAGVVTAAVLDFASAGLKIAPQARDLRNQSTYLQGAVDGAITNIRNSTALGTVNGPACPTFRPPAASASGVTGAYGQVFSVSCMPLAVTGGGAGGVDQPNFAILTLGSGSDGLKQLNGNNILLIDGGVYSHGVIAGGTSPKAGTQVNGSIYAEGACSGKVSSTDPTFSFATSCNYSPPGGSSFGADPHYVSGVPDSSALNALIQSKDADPIPTCSGSSVNFSPGYYTETPEQLQNAYAPSCGGTFLFSPGVYYFNYSGTWSISSAIAGTPVGSTCDQTRAGAQFIFGGDSRVSVGHGSLEICPPLAGQGISGLPQRIAVYGLSATNPNNPTTVPPVQSTTLAATAAPTSTGTPAFLLPGNAQNIGESPAALSSMATLTPKQDAQLSYSAFADVPKGSVIQSVKARLVYTMGSVLSATLAAHTGTADQTFSTPASCAAGCLVDLTAFVASGSGVAWRDLNGLTLALDAITGKNENGTASVDGVELQVSYTAPALEGQTCPGNCDFFTSGNQSDVLIHGTVYTPDASWNVDLHNKNATAFDRGVIVRNLQTTASASYKQLNAPFSLPTGTPTGRLVLFRGSVGPDAAHLTELIRACVLYTDGLTSSSASGVRAGYKVTVRRWSLLQTPASETPDCH